MRHGASLRPLAIFAVASLVLSVVSVATSASPVYAGSGSVGDQDLRQLTAVGTTQLDKGSVGSDTAVDPATEFSNVNLDAGMDRLVGSQAAGPGAPSAPAVATEPATKGASFTASNPGATGFNGLTHRDQRLAANGNQFSLEPPDQALCVGNGFVVESVNLAIAVYSTAGTRLSGPTALNGFFGLPPSINRTTGVRGDFTSDPKCYFDPETGRFFLSLLQIDSAPNGALLGHASTLIATTTTGDPTGTWRKFKLDVTNDGTKADGTPGCPCFGDQPLLGADHFGLFISTNAFRIAAPEFYRGAQVYAMSKWVLAAGGTPTVVHIANLRTSVTDGSAASIQPATMPGSGSDHSAGDWDENENGGTEYFVSSQLLLAGPVNHIAVWAMSGTSTLSRSTPSVALNERLISSESYDVPPDAVQRDGARPLGAAVGGSLSLLSTNDHRMQQVVFGNGRLWTALTTAITPKGDSATRAGLAWFVIRPGGNEDNALNPKVDKQGYVAMSGGYLFYPSVAVDRQGRAIMNFSLSSSGTFPSVGYVQFAKNGKTGAIHTAATGAGPADGFTGYAAFGGNGSERWGDYSAATDADGNVWFANEYIPNLPRTVNANWGTWIGTVTPQSDEPGDN